MNTSQGMVAIVTGAASGIGLSVASRLIANGAKVVAVDVDDAGLQKLAAQSGERSHQIRTLAGTLLADEIPIAAAALAMESFGAIDYLVNVVGGSVPPGANRPERGVLDMDASFLGDVLDYNVLTAFRCIKAVLPAMRKAGYGRIVNTGSVAGYGLSFYSSMAYAAAKAALATMTRRLGTELGSLGIAVNLVAPGFTITPRGKVLLDSLPPEEAVNLQTRTPLGRAALPEDIADAIIFLLSDQASFINGSVLDVNGGYWLG